MTDFFETTIKNYSGLSTETKPTIAAGNNVPNGSRWREVDTGKVYIYNLSDDAWYRFIDNVTLESNGGVPVNIQDQHSRALDLKFIKALAAPTTLSVQANIGDLTITVTSTTGFVSGVTVGIFTAGGDFYFGEQVGALAGNVVTLDTPVDVIFPIGSTCLPANHHMNVDGSGTSQIFQVGPVGGSTGVEIDITRIMGNISDGAAMDDGKFGGIPILTNGCILRRNNGVITNIWNVKSNGAIALICFDAQYTTKAPSGENGYRFRNTYAGPSKHGVTIRLEPEDTLELIIQDDLTDLTDFQMMAQGHLVTN